MTEKSEGYLSHWKITFHTRQCRHTDIFNFMPKVLQRYLNFLFKKKILSDHPVSPEQLTQWISLSRRWVVIDTGLWSPFVSEGVHAAAFLLAETRAFQDQETPCLESLADFRPLQLEKCSMISKLWLKWQL